MLTHIFYIKYISFISLKFNIKKNLIINNLNYIYQKNFKYNKLIIKLQIKKKKIQIFF